MKKEYSDETILEEIQSKSKERIEKVIEVLYLDKFFFEKALRVINRQLLPPFKNDTSIQLDVFGKGLNKFIKKILSNEFNQDSSVRTFIIGICRNLARDQNRKLASLKHKNTILSDSIENLPIADLDNPETLYIERESGIWAVVQRLTSLLNKNCKQYLLLKHYEGKTNKEIAEIMNVSKNTVSNSFLPNCHKKLRELLKKDQDGIALIKKRLQTRM